MAHSDTTNPHQHEHGPGHAHGHVHGAGSGIAFALGIVLNLAFVAIAATFGVISHSVALLADAGHNLSDVLVLAIAWGAGVLARRQPTHRYTYGLRSTSILAALFNAIVLLIAVGGIFVEAIDHFVAPRMVSSGIVMAVAAFGIVINGATAFLFMRGHHDINIRAAFMHMATDAAVSAGIVLAGGAMLITHWYWLDPMASLVVATIIVIGTWRLLRDSVNMALDAVPAGIDPAEVHDLLARAAGVDAVHDLHIWPMSTTETALTCHLVMPSGHPGDRALGHLAQELHDQFGIGHATIQVETGDPDHPCKLVPDHVV
jgi:cobalt-zinc-cadmium efflux system protein